MPKWSKRCSKPPSITSEAAREPVCSSSQGSENKPFVFAWSHTMPPLELSSEVGLVLESQFAGNPLRRVPILQDISGGDRAFLPQPDAGRHSQRSNNHSPEGAFADSQVLRDCIGAEPFPAQQRGNVPDSPVLLAPEPPEPPLEPEEAIPGSGIAVLSSWHMPECFGQLNRWQGGESIPCSRRKCRMPAGPLSCRLVIPQANCKSRGAGS